MRYEKNFFIHNHLHFSLSASCDNKNTNNPTNEIWHLVNVSEGFAGINKTIEKGDIIWTFNSQDSTLVAQNKSNSPNGLNSGSFKYNILSINNDHYLVVDEHQFGGIITSETELKIDQNRQSSASGADKFNYLFEKEPSVQKQ